MRERNSYAFAVVSVAAGLVIENGAIKQARLALGGVAAKPWRPREAEALLAGQPANASAFQRAADAALAGAKPSGDNAYKIPLARNLIVRALQAAHQGTPARMPALPASPFSSVPGVLHDA
ncbi:putative aldehyde or xanthine dehydrogenase, FAD-binding subunit (YagS-like) (fragment) [Bradyrhizobium sp. STM 3843]